MLNRRKENGYKRTYELVQDKLKNCDVRELCRRVGFEVPQTGDIEVDFLGHRFTVRNQGIFCDETERDYPIEKSILIYYLTSGEYGPAGEEFLFSTQFETGLKTSSGGTTLEWQSRTLSQKIQAVGIEGLREGMKTLGAEEKPVNSEGKYLWQMQVLPNVAAQMICYEADDEFPCMTQIKFDSHAGRYFAFEQLAFLQGCIISKIQEALKGEKE